MLPLNFPCYLTSSSGGSHYHSLSTLGHSPGSGDQGGTRGTPLLGRALDPISWPGKMSQTQTRRSHLCALSFVPIFTSLSILCSEQKVLGCAAPLMPWLVLGTSLLRSHHRHVSSSFQLSMTSPALFFLFFFPSFLLSTKLKGQVEFTVTIHIS